MSNSPDSPGLRHATTPVHGRYFVAPSQSKTADLWLIGFHGQAQTADLFLEDLERVPRSPGWLVASVQGLNTYYAGRSRAVVANWMTSQDRELTITDNVAWVNTVLDHLEREFGAPRAIVFAGFSQGVAMAYRAGLLCARTCAAVVAVGGDVPPELKSGVMRNWPRVLVTTGTKDGWYTPERLAADMEFLRTCRPDVQTLLFAGGHEWTQEVSDAIGQLLAEVERVARA